LKKRRKKRIFSIYFEQISKELRVFNSNKFYYTEKINKNFDKKIIEVFHY
jgi:hypothetical protein